MTQKNIMPLDLLISCTGDTAEDLRHHGNWQEGTQHILVSAGTCICASQHGIRVAKPPQCKPSRTHTHTQRWWNKVRSLGHNKAVSHSQTSELQLQMCIVPVQHRPLQTGYFTGWKSRMVMKLFTKKDTFYFFKTSRILGLPPPTESS